MNLAAVRAQMRPTPGATPAAPPSNVVPLRSVPLDAAPAAAPDPTWTKYAATFFAGVGVTACAASIRAGGNKPREPEDREVDGVRDALDKMLRLRFGDAAPPLWLESALAFGSLYASMRIGAEPIGGVALVPDQQPQAAAADPPPPPRTPSTPKMNLTMPPPVNYQGGAGNGS